MGVRATGTGEVSEKGESMKVKLRQPITSREEIAKFVSCVVQGRQEIDVPYQTTPRNISDWVLDSSNDWWLNFKDDHTFKIVHRYFDNDATEALCKWVAYRLGGEVVE